RRVGADDLGAGCLSVLEVDLHRGRAGDDVLVGEDVALRVVHDAGALAGGLLLLAAATAEPKPAALLLLSDGDVDDAGAGGAVNLIDREPLGGAQRSRDRRVLALRLRDGRGDGVGTGAATGHNQGDGPTSNGSSDDWNK